MILELDSTARIILWTGLSLYIVILLVIGWYSGRKVKGMSDFLVAGRRLPLWMATATLLATWFGAGSSMGVAATVYSGSLRDVIADPFAASISLILAGVFFVGIMRRNKCLTVTDTIERQYGKTAGVYASLWMIPVYIAWLGAQVIGLGEILNILTGIDDSLNALMHCNIPWGLVIGALIVLIYTTAGGMWAVTLTDVVQVLILIVGLFLILPGAVHSAGGWHAVYSNPEADLSLLPKETGWTNWVHYAGTWMVMGLGCMVGQDLVQRSLSSRTVNIAKQSSILSGLMYMMIGILPITIGLAAKILFPRWGLTTEILGENIDNQVLPRIAINVLGATKPVFLMFFISALVAAIMSSADSSLLAGASLFSNNVLRPMAPKIKDRQILTITRIITVLFLIVATLIAMKVQSIYALMTNAWASQLVIIFVPVVGALYLPKSSTRTAWAAMGSATVVWIGYLAIGAVRITGSFSEVMEADQFQFDLTVGAVYGFLAAALVFAGSYLAFDRKRAAVPAVIPSDDDTDDAENAESGAGPDGEKSCEPEELPQEPI